MIYLVIKKIASVAIVLAICFMMRGFWDIFLAYKDLSYGFQQDLNLTEVLIRLSKPNEDLSLINSVFLNAIIPTFVDLESFFSSSKCFGYLNCLFI